MLIQARAMVSGAHSRLVRTGGPLCTVSFALLLVTGCGNDGSEAAARGALERVAAGDGAGLCEYLSEQALAKMGNADNSVAACRDEYASHSLGEGPENADVTIESSTESESGVAVEARIGPPADQQDVRVLLVQEGAGWKVDEVVYEGIAAAAAGARAKNLARTAQAALEAYAADNRGSYAGARAKNLARLEPILDGAQYDLRAEDDTYRVGAQSDAGSTFSIVGRGGGKTELRCSPPGAADCPDDGDWGT